MNSQNPDDPRRKSWDETLQLRIAYIQTMERVLYKDYNEKKVYRYLNKLTGLQLWDYLDELIPIYLQYKSFQKPTIIMSKSKFELTFCVNGEEAKGKRGSIMRNQGENEIKKLITEKESEINSKEMALEDVNDFMPTDTTATKVVFDARRWAETNKELRLDLIELRIELKELNAIYEEWFNVSGPATV